MERIVVTLQKFKEQGEKTGWTYLEISAKLADKLSPGNKKSFRVKGKMDSYIFQQVALVPMGEGNFILAFNAAMRKGTGKKQGDKILLEIEVDTSERKISEDLLNCLGEEEKMLSRFLALPKGHQNYYSNWIESAKTEATRSDRIVKTLFAMQHEMDYGQMIRHFKNKK